MLRDPEGKECKIIRDILGPSAGDVLEGGCGDGRLTGALAGVSGNVLGLDPDPGTIDQARSFQGNGVRLILGSGESIPLAHNSVDTVVFSLSLHHQDPDKALAQARRVLREQGRILVLEPVAQSPINRFFGLIHNEDEAYDRAAMAVSKCGLDLADLGTYSTIWRFDDFEEMVSHLYSYFDLEPEQPQVEAMENILGSKAKDRPLEIEDMTRWWFLSSRQPV